jgi:hypothetical protein
VPALVLSEGPHGQTGRVGYGTKGIAMNSSLLPGSLPAPVLITDCTTCRSAGSVRRGVCDICGARNLDTALATPAPSIPRERRDSGRLVPL